MIFQRGVFEEQAKAIMDYVIPKFDALAVDMKISHKMDWNGRADRYPDVLYLTIFNLNLKPLVVEWIDANTPQAWYRSMFI